MTKILGASIWASKPRVLPGAHIFLDPPYGRTRLEKLRKRLNFTRYGSPEHEEARAAYITLSLLLYPAGNDPYMFLEDPEPNAQLEGDEAQ